MKMPSYRNPRPMAREPITGVEVTELDMTPEEFDRAFQRTQAADLDWPRVSGQEAKQ